MLPEAIQLRKDDAVLDERLDALHDEDDVRAAVEEFNARIVSARRQLMGGPPVVTPLRDVEREVRRWQSRRRVPEPPPAPEPDRASRRRRRRPAWAVRRLTTLSGPRGPGGSSSGSRTTSVIGQDAAGERPGTPVARR